MKAKPTKVWLFCSQNIKEFEFLNKKNYFCNHFNNILQNECKFVIHNLSYLQWNFLQ